MTSMLTNRWMLSLPLILAASVAPARAAAIRDEARMFDPGTVAQANRELDRVEAKYGLPVTIETIASLEGRNPHEVLQQHARAAGAHGLYVLISKQDHKIEVEASGPYRRAFSRERTERVWKPMAAEFKNGDFDAGLLAGVRAIDSQAAEAKAESGSLREGGVGQPRRAIPNAVPPGVRRPQHGGGFGIGTLLGIGLLVLAVLVGIRLLGALFGAGRGGHYGPGRMGGPGYGGPGYGGGGGGFMSGLFGGLGGALAGNWLYDQFSGRHHQGGGYVENTSYGDADTGATAPDNNDWGGSGGDWGGGDAGGGGGGDWGGGGDAGGGGDWGGGGGGDWGGGGGGGDGGGW